MKTKLFIALIFALAIVGIFYRPILGEVYYYNGTAADDSLDFERARENYEQAVSYCNQQAVQNLLQPYSEKGAFFKLSKSKQALTFYDQIETLEDTNDQYTLGIAYREVAQSSNPKY